MRVWHGGWAGAALVVVGIVSSARAQAPGASKIEDGNFHLRAHFQYFPTPDDLANVRAQVERARMQLCDATDGAVKVKKITVSVGQASEEQGDLWFLNGNGRSRANLLGGHATLFREGGGYNGATIAHELGHSLLGLGDNYKERNRSWDGCGMGEGFDPGLATGADNSIMQDSRTLCTLPDGRSLGEIDPLWETGCAGETCGSCTACTGLPDTTLSCEPSQPLRSELSVAANFDPVAGSDATVCPSVRPATRVRVTGAFSGGRSNFPELASCGNGVVEPAFGEQCDDADILTPLPLCSSFGLAAGTISDRALCDGCQLNKATCAVPTGVDSCALTVGLPDACVGPSPGTVPAGVTCQSRGFLGGSPGCDDCSLNLSLCTPVSTCGDGVVQAPEECDLGADNGTGVPLPGMRLCSEVFGPTVSGFLRCNANCSINKDDCEMACPAVQGFPDACSVAGGLEVPPASCADFGYGKGEATCNFCSLQITGCGPPFDGSSWESARVHASAGSDWLLAVDEKGDRHLFRFYAVRIVDSTWEVHVLGQADDYVGGIAGLTQHIRTFHVELDLDAGAVASVASGTGPVVAGAAGTMTLGGVPSDGTGEGTPPFVVGPVGQAGPLALTVDFSAITRAQWLRYYDDPSRPLGPTSFFPDTAVLAGNGEEFPIARCDRPSVCTELWNQTTNDWEGVQQRWDQKYAEPIAPLFDPLTGAVSDWDLLVKTAASQYGLTVTPPDDRPQQGVPTEDQCGGPLEWDDTAVTALAPDAIVLVIDRSGSMATRVDADSTFGEGTAESRFAFAKAAARSFADLAARSTPAPRVGLVSFSTTATDPPEQPVAELILTGTPGDGQATLADFKATIDDMGLLDDTAIGLGLDAAQQMLSGSTFMARTVLLMTDGENNQPRPIGDFDPLAVAQRMITEDNIRVFTVPTGRSADRTLLAGIANATGAAMLDAPLSDELPAIYAEAYALTNGESLIFPRTSVRVNASTPCGPDEIPNCALTWQVVTVFGCMCVPPGTPVETATRNLVVEEGAETLTVLLSARNTEVDTWNPLFRLVDPNGVVRLLETSTEVVNDRFYRILTVPNPEPGVWLLHLGALGLFDDQIQYVQAHARQPELDCYPRLSRTIVGEGESVVVSAGAYAGGRLIPGAHIAAEIERPDGSSEALPQSSAFSGGERHFVVDPSFYVGRGSYAVRVTCTVFEGTEFALGEGAIGPEPGEEANFAPAFTRAARRSFFLNAASEPPLEPGGDCDRNGILNEDEEPGDFDGDGLSDACDEDDDSDDVPEPGDADPRSSTCGVPACPIANAGPDQVVECNLSDAATVTLDGSGSSDPDGETLTYAWSSSVMLDGADQAIATGVFPLNESRSATLTVRDASNESTDDVLITVLDTSPPVLTPPPDVAVPTCGAVSIGSATAVDACGGSVTIVSDAPATFSKAGRKVVTWRAIDRFGNIAEATQIVTVGVGNNPACCPTGTTLKMGTSNNDTLTGTSGADCIIGLGAQDTIKGLGGNDYLSGGEGDDIVEGGDGADQLEGGSGQDTLRGQNGDDALLGFDGDDHCYGGIGHDRQHGGQGQDRLYGEDGNDTLLGEVGDDRLEGGAGNDLLNGGGLHDTCLGGSGTNTLLSCEIQQ